MTKRALAAAILAVLTIGAVALPFSSAASADEVVDETTALVEQAAEDVVGEVEDAQAVALLDGAIDDATDTSAEASEGVKNRRVAVCVALIGAITAVVCEIISQLPG